MKKSYILIAVAAILVITCAATVLGAGSGSYEEKSGWQRAVYALIHRDEIINTKYVGTVSDYVWSPDLNYRVEDRAVVQKNPNKDFVIMNVTDLHLSDYTQDAVTNIRNLENIRRMAEELQPDLITLSGDLVWTQMKEGSVVYSAHRLTEFMDSLGISWAPIFGNHDFEGNCDLNYLADIMMQGQFCVMQKGDVSMGVGNYVVNICEGEKLIHSVILMDSHSDGALSEKQVQWFRWAVEGASMESGNQVSSSLILHIPVAQYRYAYTAAWDKENGCWRDGYESFGGKREEILCHTDENDDPVDSGIFDVMKEVGTDNVLCGHDHVNNFSVLWEGVRLTYSLRLGYGAYFDGENRECQGVTTITIDSDGDSTVEHHYLYPYDVILP